MGGGSAGDGGLLSSVKNPFDDWQKKGKWDWNAVLNDVVQPIRVGIGYDFKKGRLYDNSMKHIEDITGRSAAKKANEKKQNDINAEKVARAREADLLWLDNYRRDAAGSSAAAGVQASADARARTAGSSPATAQKLGGTSEDLLGV